MRTHLSIALVILAISTGAAVATNALRDKSLDWIRRDLPETPPANDAKEQTQLGAASDSTSGGAASLANQAASADGGITADVVLGHLTSGTARFVDAREAKEFAAGHLRGAKNIPSSAIYANIGNLIHTVPAHEKIIVYCGGGECEASHHVSDALRRDFRFQDVSIFVKGWEEVEKNERFRPFIAVGEEP
jgi:hypothetical protein